MPARIDLTGQRFGKLVVQQCVRSESRYRLIWGCICDCGNSKEVYASLLRNGKTQSCGCLRKEQATLFSQGHRVNVTHGMSKTKVFSIWKAMNLRCYNPNNSSYKEYGGRGITVCDRWRGKEGLEAFLIDMGHPPTDKHSLDRIITDGNYDPSNCRWATSKQQARNRRDNRILEYAGNKMCVADWADLLNVNHEIIRGRIKLGWSAERIFQTDPCCYAPIK